MATNKVLDINIYKKKCRGSFILSVGNNMEIFTESVKVHSEDGVIEKNTIYDLEKVIQKFIASAKKKVGEKVINWNIHFNQESFIQCQFGSRCRVYGISEQEIDVVYNMAKIMNEDDY